MSKQPEESLLSKAKNNLELARDLMKISRDIAGEIKIILFIDIWGSASIDKSRSQLLEAVKVEVKQYLRDNLHNQCMISLHMQEQNKAVGRRVLPKIPEPEAGQEEFPWYKRFFKNHNQPGKLIGEIMPEHKIIDLFEREDINRRLLILGAPYSGKTITLFDLADHLLERAEQDPEKPIPVILKLSKWSGQPLEKFIVEQLKQAYSIQKRFTHLWINDKKLLPLLDGLNELGLKQRIKCVDEINKYLKCLGRSAVVCCRSKEYEHIEVNLKLHGAVRLEPLSSEQIHSYLNCVNRTVLWENINAYKWLMELAKIPSTLALVVTVLQPKQKIINKKQLIAEIEAFANQQSTMAIEKLKLPQTSANHNK
jgi:predicted NACHT family NTPase